MVAGGHWKPGHRQVQSVRTGIKANPPNVMLLTLNLPQYRPEENGSRLSAHSREYSRVESHRYTREEKEAYQRGSAFTFSHFLWTRVLIFPHSLPLWYLQAFSGIKNATTQRQKREARMQGLSSSVCMSEQGVIDWLNWIQDLIELFGMRRRAASNSQATLDQFRNSA